VDTHDDETPGQWEDELEPWPEDRRRVARRRAAFVIGCTVLVALIVLTIAFVGDDTTSRARIAAADGASTTATTSGFDASLPVAATAISVASTGTDASSSTDSSSTTATTSNTGSTGSTGSTVTTSTTSTSTTTSTTLPPFTMNGPRSGDGKYAPIDPNSCGSQPPSRPADPFVFSTPKPGTLRLQVANANGEGPIDSTGHFTVTLVGTTLTYTGQLPSPSPSSATGTLATGNACEDRYAVSWTFG
jgi:hypothetical protein